MFKIVQYIVCSMCLCLSFHAQANDFSIQVFSTDIHDDTLVVEFSVDWKHSWNESTSELNHDASWLFFKAKDAQTNNWSTAHFDEVLETDFDYEWVDSKMGLLLKSNVSQTNQASYGMITVRFVGMGSISAFYAGGIEMVYVPDGAFDLGDAISTNSFKNNNDEPVRIESEDELLVGIDITSIKPESIVGNVSADYPKGFDAFYCMKYEISQNQFTDFLNHLTYSEQAAILPIDPNSTVGTKAMHSGTNAYFNGVTLYNPGDVTNNKGAHFICDLNKDGDSNGETDGEDLACSFLSWQQLLHYLDWTGLRPMTEFEFEKACRGPLPSVDRELAFGTSNVTDANTLLYDSTEFETYSIALAEGYGVAAHGYAGRQGALRVGFAADETSDRLSSGASYWGIMELSGNLWEQTIGVNKANGLLFQGSQGDGELSALPEDWKFESSMVKGGAWNSGVFATFRDIAVSDRHYYALSAEFARNTTGGRGVLSSKKLNK